MRVFYKRSRVPIVLFWMGSWLSVLAAESETLPDAPSTAVRIDFYAAQRTDTSADPPQSHGFTTSSDSDNIKFLTRWVKRGLRDQSDIYASPFHRSEVKWVIGLPAVTLGLIAIDKHASDAPSRNWTNASADISHVGLFTTAGTLGVFLLDSVARDNPMLAKPTCWEPSPRPTLTFCMSCCSTSPNVNAPPRRRQGAFLSDQWMSAMVKLLDPLEMSLDEVEM